ncbi:hypothetical protein P7D15_02995 [Bacillus cereus]|uniref:Uncharacterized protein n=1 Tax=Bacillus thuringiensis TaxID=1428 RepID=A0A9X6VCJ3_BACTU|nr:MULTISPECIES: hypothetical protein [Bacillus cereus group]MCU5279865.1 hypothetical protein [Bacillus cereus]MDF9599389.1 hypothetical protein [Bacillus cereus]MDG1589721.1 hypothetical protein [Bacillus cereus]MEC3270670.1 hypothetical protein [Bacillus thuringiensis]PFB08104.1 hypothetical protein CN398_10330 [Bacillus thuringiensis]
MKQNEIIKMLEKLTDKERDALQSAVSSIYDGDESDFLKSLWEIVTIIIGDNLDEEGLDIEDILKVIDPALVKKS